MKTTFPGFLQLLVCLLAAMSRCFAQPSESALFTGHGDIGAVEKAGKFEMDSPAGAYRISAGAGNLWLTNDSFYFVWRTISADDVTLAANIRWLDAVSDSRRKGCLMIRQSLDPGSAYVAAVSSEDGPACLQCREMPGGLTHQIQCNVSSPARLRLEKHGDYFTMSIANPDATFQPAGGSYRVHLAQPFYVGLAVCPHTTKRPERAEFSNVGLLTAAADSTGRSRIESTLEVIDVSSLDRRVIYQTKDHIEAPNWSRDGSFFVINSADRIWTIPISGGKPHLLDTRSAIHCGSNHGLSPDGTLLAINDFRAPDYFSRIYVLPVAGGVPKLVMAVAAAAPVPETPGQAPPPLHRVALPKAHSYWHGWSPDGKSLAYTYVQDGKVDVCTIPLQGGEATHLTRESGVNDGPDYSPDGRHIFFSSDRTGLMQIWRMKTDGSEQTQITADNYNNWLPHPSPDGQWVAFLSFSIDVKGLPENKDVMLRLLSLDSGQVSVLAKVLGGHGTMDVPSWSPDSQHLAFVSYQRIFP